MIEEPKRLRIARTRRMPTKDQIAALAGYPTGFVLDAMFGAGAMDAVVKPLPGLPFRVCGPALTVGNQPGDILATLAAVHLAEPGHVIVAEAHGHTGHAAGGDRLLGMLKNRGAVGFVTDGTMRDLDGLEQVGLPCWCTGLTPNSPVARGPGTLGLPVQVGGQRVETGDMIVADRDGVVVVPFAMIDRVISAVAKVAEAETALDAEVAGGLAEIGLISDMLDDPDAVEWV